MQNDQQTRVSVFITSAINKATVKRGGGVQTSAELIQLDQGESNDNTFFFKPAVPFIANIGNVIPRVYFSL